jgi:glutathione S-transferase
MSSLQLLPSWLEWYNGKTVEEKAEGMKKTLVAVELLEAALKECSKGKPFFGGDRVGYLDFTLGGFVPWAHAGEKLYGFRVFDAARSPLLDAWVERFCALDAAKEVLPTDRLVEYAKMTKAEEAAAAASNN